MSFDINNMNEQSLAVLGSEQLITLVLSLKEENERFRQISEDFISKKYDKRLESIERKINLHQQYSVLFQISPTTIEVGGVSALPSDIAR